MTRVMKISLRLRSFSVRPLSRRHLLIRKAILFPPKIIARTKCRPSSLHLELRRSSRKFSTHPRKKMSKTLIKRKPSSSCRKCLVIVKNYLRLRGDKPIFSCQTKWIEEEEVLGSPAESASSRGLVLKRTITSMNKRTSWMIIQILSRTWRNPRSSENSKIMLPERRKL